MIIGVREYTIPLHYKYVLLIVPLVSSPCTVVLIYAYICSPCLCLSVLNPELCYCCNLVPHNSSLIALH